MDSSIAVHVRQSARVQLLVSDIIFSDITMRDIRTAPLFLRLGRLWNRALAASEISALYASDIAPKEDLMGEFLLNVNTGTTAVDTAQENNGNIFNGTWADAGIRPRGLGSVVDRRRCRAGARTDIWITHITSWCCSQHIQPSRVREGFRW